jgi:DNA repair protein RadC
MKEKTISNSIKNWAPEDRPREKLLMKGKSALSDAELIAILLGSGNFKESALDLAKRILKDVENDLIQLGSVSVERLMKYQGVGKAKAVSIAAAIDLGRRYRESAVKRTNSIQSSKDVFEYMQSVIGALPHEEFWAIYLNVKNQIITRVQIGEGGTTQTIVDPKKVFRLALDHNAVNVIVCHNHPSGGIVPSNSDISLTHKLRQGAQILDLNLLDHIIVGTDKYFSFADEGIIDK